MPPDLLHDIVMLKLEMVGLPCKHASKMPAALSGGMVKRVGIARAIALEPELLFLDEPTAGLDPQASDEFVELIATLHRTLGLTVVMVTHDLDTMVALSTRVAVLADRKVLVAAPVEEAANVDHPFIHEYFLGLRGRRALQALPPERRAKLPKAASNRRCRASSCRHEGIREWKTNHMRSGRPVHDRADARDRGHRVLVQRRPHRARAVRTARATNVTGLFPDAAVRFRGLDVGKVQSIGFDRTHPGQIRIRILVDHDAPITQSTYGSLGFQGVTGIAFVQLEDTGRDLAAAAVVAEGDRADPDAAEPVRPDPGRGDVLLRQLELAAKSANALMSPEMREQLRATAESLQHAADGAATLTKQLGPAVTALPETMHEVNRAMASANTLLQPNGPLVSNLNKPARPPSRSASR